MKLTTNYLNILASKIPSEILLNAHEQQVLDPSTLCYFMLCLGFNSLLASASINHLHFHIWQCPEVIFAMTADTVFKHTTPGFLELKHHPVPNFAIHLNHLNELDSFIESLWKVITSCLELGIAHNLLLCRHHGSGRLRAIIWPRRSILGAKSLQTCLNSGVSSSVAVVELAGMFVTGKREALTTTKSNDLIELLDGERLPQDQLDQLNQRINTFDK